MSVTLPTFTPLEDSLFLTLYARAADVRDPDWLDAVPTGRPAVIVADGMTAFLSRPAPPLLTCS